MYTPTRLTIFYDPKSALLLSLVRERHAIKIIRKWYAYLARSAPMTDNYFSPFRLTFLFSVGREWPLLLAISLW
jgi:hypothetical protein